jgi:hypothetical protein
MDKQLSLCAMIDRIYEVIVMGKFFIFITIIKGLEHYIGLCVGKRKNNFLIDFVNEKFDLKKNFSFYRVPDRINVNYILNTKENAQNI